ncbi:occludin/ELL domain-containing protein 1 isoform X2 [Nycticebus coucang]|uniref:occludin/ELL domain-containing protein 1 isoform X2 n=1 Tax=Nycticebus coucang TaxID=9470 RepID=UPI00234D06F4|nr:occludin/ELL domain-containing protein 1 isoform X2 [Nycticebus coucang]
MTCRRGRGPGGLVGGGAPSCPEGNALTVRGLTGALPKLHSDIKAARKPPPPSSGHDVSRKTRLSARGPRSGISQRPMPSRERPHIRSSRGDPQTRLPDPGPPPLMPPGLKTSVSGPLCQPQPEAYKARPKKIVFEDELPSQTLLSAKRSIVAIPGGHIPIPHPVPDYELKYPPVRSKRERSRYAAVFQDQYGEFKELQQEKEAQVAARVWREFEKKQRDPGFLDKQARCHYLKGKLRHLKTQIQIFDNQGGSEGSVYF